MAQYLAASCFPTPEQELLLRAALLSGDAGLAAWNQWKSRVDFDLLDSGSQRLLPQLYVNLSAQGIDDPLMGRLKGFYRQSWYKNQLLFHTSENLLRAFHAAGIRTMLLKGAALTLLYYRDNGVRPINDLDVVVPAQAVPQALAVLRELGWRPKEDKSAEQLEYALTENSATGFFYGDQAEFNLHSRVAHRCWRYYPHDPWKDALPVTLNGVETLALSHAEQLIYVCVHGLIWNVLPPMRWVADAAVLLRAQPTLDWASVVAHAKAAHLTLPMYAALSYVKTLLDFDIPEWVLRDLERTPVSPAERLRLKAAIFPPRIAANVLIHYDSYADLRRIQNAPPSLTGVLRYFQRLWGVERLWQVPFHGVSRTTKRLRGR